MKKVIHKWFIDWEKEEAWINELASKGLALTSIGFCRFEFEECSPGDYIYRCELLENLPSHPESERYIRFVEETGCEHIATWMRWVYFRKKTADGAFELFSDHTSKIKHLKRILLLLGIIGGMNLFMGTYNLFLAFTFGSSVNLLGLANILLGIFLGALFVKYFKRKKKLTDEQTLFES